MDTFNSDGPKSQEFKCEKILVKRKCKYCDFITDLRITLDDHVWRYHKISHDNKSDLQIKIYPCGKCDFESYSLLVWRLHQNRCTYIYKKNSKCSETPCRQSGIPKQHNAAESKLNPSEYFANNAISSKTLVILNHASRMNRCRVNLEEDKLFECDQCGHKAKQKRYLKDHILAHHTAPEDIKWFTCDRCEYKTKRKGDVKNHINLRHARENLVELKCSQCLFKTFLKGSLRNHMTTQHGNREGFNWFECDQCEYKAKYKHVLKSHIVAHHTVPEEIKWFECQQCEYKAKRKQVLKNHIIAHHTAPEETKWFECDRCKYKTKLKSTLKQHINRIHTRDNLVELECS